MTRNLSGPERSAIHIDILTGEANPYPFYKLWRMNNPVFQFEPDGLWAVCRYDDVKYALTNPGIFSSEANKDYFQTKWLDRRYWKDLGFLSMDPPEHTRYRRLISKDFAYEAVKLLVPFMKETVRSLISNIPPHQETEFLGEFACPCAGNLIDHILGTENGLILKNLQTQPQLDNVHDLLKPDPRLIKEQEHAAQQEIDYLMSFIEKRRLKPEDDLISKLLSVELDGKKLTDTMICNIMSLFLLAGTNALSHLLCHMIIFLSRRPDIFQALKKDSSEIPAFIEELLRFSSPAPTVIRRTTEGVILSGVTIPKGKNVLLFIASANRDPSIFPKPDEFDITRPNINKHLSFGFGPHKCLGAYLTRLKVRIILECILDKFNGVTCPGDDQLDWNNSFMMNSVEKLPLSFF